MGETAIDEDTFNDYIQEMNSVYTADKVCITLTAEGVTDILTSIEVSPSRYD